MNQLNRIYHDNFLNNNLPDKSVNLIIADPPYFEVKGDFDFVWASFQDYLIDVEKWFVEFKRILKENGTLLYYGDSKKIAYSQIIGDKYFGLLSNVTIHIYDRQTNKIRIEDARSFINTTERMLMYSNDVYNLPLCIYSIRDYIRSEIIKSKGKIIFKEINQALGAATTGGGIASACLSLNKTEPAMITKEMYSKLRIYLNENINQEYDFLNQEYDVLKHEYDNLRRPFNPIEEYKMDVLKFSQEGHITGKYDHDTVKPEKMTRYFIQTCSNIGDLVFVPFAGSGTECAMSISEGRNFIGYDILKKNVDMSNERVKKITDSPKLF